MIFFVAIRQSYKSRKILVNAIHIALIGDHSEEVFPQSSNLADVVFLNLTKANIQTNKKYSLVSDFYPITH